LRVIPNLIVLRPGDAKEFDELLDASSYEKLVAAEEH
jgi:hypothetical protein